jgi:hypothetical protein
MTEKKMGMDIEAFSDHSNEIGKGINRLCDDLYAATEDEISLEGLWPEKRRSHSLKSCCQKQPVGCAMVCKKRMKIIQKTSLSIQRN